ncbi:MAG: APC family permease [Gemmatimonadaceae bacterium]
MRRELGTVDGAALVVSTVVGVGIFVSPGIVAGLVPSPLPMLAVWAAGGLLALCGALVYAELAATYPAAGGEYVYIRRAFGPLAGFLSGWTSLVAGFSGAIAAAGVGFAEYLGRFVPLAAETSVLAAVGISGAQLTVTPRALVAIGVIVLFSAVHLRGLGPGRVVNSALAALNVVTVLVLVAVGFAIGDAPARDWATESRPWTVGAWLLALIPVMFTYSGWNAPAYLGGEFREPGRSLPRAFLLGTCIVLALYLALVALYVHALGVGALARTTAVGDRAAAALLGRTGAMLLGPLVLAALASSVSAMVMTGPRVYYAMARDGALPAALARLSPTSGVPARALVAQSAWSCLLVITGAFEALLTYTGFAIVLFGGVAVASVFVLRRHDAALARPYRVWGYPLTPAAFVVASVAIVVQAIRLAPAPSLWGTAIILLGAPVWWWTAVRGQGRRKEERGGRTECAELSPPASLLPPPSLEPESESQRQRHSVDRPEGPDLRRRPVARAVPDRLPSAVPERNVPDVGREQPRGPAQIGEAAQRDSDAQARAGGRPPARGREQVGADGILELHALREALTLRH